MMNTAPKIDARANVFVLGWNICVIACAVSSHE